MQKFNEWMSFQQTNMEDGTSDYQFVGTYDSEKLVNLEENSDLLELKDALELIPKSYRNQFSEIQKIKAGKSLDENNKEVVWLSVNDINTTYIFAKN